MWSEVDTKVLILIHCLITIFFPFTGWFKPDKMDGRFKLSSASKLLSPSTFVCLYFLFFDHKHFSLSIRIGNETIRPANKIINISYQGSPTQLQLHMVKNQDEVESIWRHPKNASSHQNNEVEHVLNSTKRNKRPLKNESKIDASASSMRSRMKRSALSRKQKLGPIFYREPPPTFYFSNDTGTIIQLWAILNYIKVVLEKIYDFTISIYL